ncbi:unnamed protein product [Rotaria sp. Silwood2]|nr:unnamed protein product [Rotaria sp. Silwood2]CAF4102904.1 unnamed protein product [Rotaria sp. Silwood2]
MTVTERFVDADEEPLRRIMPIEDYENEPLVTLQEATKNLQRSIKKINAMVRIAKKNYISDPTNNLTVDEAAAIYLYTIEKKKAHKTVSFQLNKTLRSNERNELTPWLSYLRLFLSGLNKLPSIKGTIWRFARGDVTGNYQTDCVWFGFSSCTGIKLVLDRFLDRTSMYTLFRIECINGKSIHNYSSRPDEDEVLLMPGTYLRLMSKGKLQNGLCFVHLQENVPQYLHPGQPLEFSSSTYDTHRTDQYFRSPTIQPNDQKKCM